MGIGGQKPYDEDADYMKHSRLFRWALVWGWDASVQAASLGTQPEQLLCHIPAFYMSWVLTNSCLMLSLSISLQVLQ